MFSEVTEVIKEHMLHPESLLKQSPNLSELEDRGRPLDMSKVKQGSLTYSEYQDRCSSVYQLLCDCELFYEVNTDLIERETRKRGTGKGSWRSTRQLRKFTRIMERLLLLSKNLQLKSINTAEGDYTTLFHHFKTEDERTNLDQDTKNEVILHDGNDRIISYRFLPQIVQIEENMKLLEEYYQIEKDFVKLAEKCTEPVNLLCCRTSCRCCFKSIFGEEKQTGEILAKSLSGKHFWVKSPKSKTKVDAMFFPASGEKIDKQNLKAEKDYKKLPTMILCA